MAWSIILLQKLSVTHLMKKFAPCYGFQNFFFRSERPTTGSYLTQNIPPHYNIILPPTPYSPSGLQLHYLRFKYRVCF